MAKTDNARGATDAKVQLRLNVLDCVRPARVFDAFAGLGNMYLRAWSKADSYVGCDERDWSPSEPHKRFVCDNRIVMRAIDLQAFNIFDFDAYGMPWDQMLILLHRRTWAKGEIGAVVLTDGSSLKIRVGGMSNAMATLLGAQAARDNLPRNLHHLQAIRRLTLKRWCQLARVAPRRLWEATGRGSGRGGTQMAYTACVFEGLGPEPDEAHAEKPLELEA